MDILVMVVSTFVEVCRWCKLGGNSAKSKVMAAEKEGEFSCSVRIWKFKVNLLIWVL